MARRSSRTYIFSGGRGASQEQIKELKQYVDDSMAGAGAVAGVPCQIQSITPIEGGNRVTFLWEDNAGNDHTSSLDVRDGISVVSAVIDVSNHLVLNLSNGTHIDAGAMPVVDNASAVTYSNASKPELTNVKLGLDAALSQNAEDIAYANPSFTNLTNVKLAIDKALTTGAVLNNPITVSNPLGSATSGKVYEKNTELESILRDILVLEEAPGLTLNISPNKTLYDVVEDTVSSVTMNTVVTKKTYSLSKVEFYVNNVLKDTQNISTSGTYAYVATFSPATNANFTLKAIVYDKKTGTPLSTTKTVQVKFVGKSYFGTITDDAGEPTEAIIKALQNKTLKDVKKLVYSHITMEYGKVVYAYPASFGALTKISDEKNNINYTTSFGRTSIMVDGIAYYCYTQLESSASTDVELTFA